jgi:hypothetical protein
MNNNPLERLLDEIKYQVFAPEVTTMGECECGSASRGGRTCLYCLQDELGNTTSHDLADSYIAALYHLKSKQEKYNEHKTKQGRD